MTDKEKEFLKKIELKKQAGCKMLECGIIDKNIELNKKIIELKKIEEAHRELNGELRKELQLKDKIVMDIVKRLDNDIKNITETKADGYTDDYRRCRLKAYRTKTREIKEYIVKEYFTKKASGK